MSLDRILEILEERGLSIVVPADGQPRVVGKKEDVTDAMREALSAYREEIIARFKPKFPRRVVLLKDGTDGEIETVLEECEGKGHHERIREHARQHPGRDIAGEWRQVRDGREQWTRFLVLHAPSAAAPKAAPDT